MKEALRAALVLKHPGPLWRRRGESSYQVAGSRVRVRNGTRDVSILADIFSRNEYESDLDIEPRTILDLGANIGLFSIWARRRWPVESVVAVEPDPANTRLLRENVTCQVIEACAGTSRGSVGFEAGRFSESRIGSGPQVEVIDTFTLGTFDLVKLDIEGGEWELLADGRLPTLAPVMVMEWHARGCPAAEPEQHVVQLLEGHGFTVRDHRVPGHRQNGTLWALR